MFQGTKATALKHRGPCQLMAKVLDETVEAPESGIPGGAARCCSGARSSSWYLMVSSPEQALEQVGEGIGSAVEGFAPPGRGAA